MLNVISYLRYLHRFYGARPKRYRHLFKTIIDHRCRRILEVGTFDGTHAAQMIKTAKVLYPPHEIEYVGFDLFEGLTDEKFREEFAARRPPSAAQVRERLVRTGAQITLYQGDTRKTLPEVKDRLGVFDLIFIDGGHSVETVLSDWANVKELMTRGTIVIFDDYYSVQHPRLDGLGCRCLVEGLDRESYEVEVLEPRDRFTQDWGVLEINFVKVKKKNLPAESAAYL